MWPERLPPVAVAVAIAITATTSSALRSHLLLPPPVRLSKPLYTPAASSTTPVLCLHPVSTMPSLLDSPPQIRAAGAWDSMYAVIVQEPVKPRHTMAVATAAAVAKKPACYGGRKKDLELCTEALGCETGGVDAAPASSNGADDKFDGEEAAARKRRAREEEEMEGRARRPLPPPLTTLARGGASRVRMVHERRDGRLAVYAVRTPGVEAERSGGRLRMRLLVSLPCRRQEAQEADVEEEVVVVEEGGECGVAKYVRGGRCAEPEGALAAAARRGKQWEPAEQAAALWVATS
ncbi:hypothetical protein U9M48_043827 [Paspalum notatum var. saurae]|uniref:FAF domain-containing protein n=1 Tax=Paspalum notatum var. saurae TaxID=547442 RepID=A0AAQ3UY92_PASNO